MRTALFFDRSFQLLDFHIEFVVLPFLIFFLFGFAVKRVPPGPGGVTNRQNHRKQRKKCEHATTDADLLSDMSGTLFVITFDNRSRSARHRVRVVKVVSPTGSAFNDGGFWSVLVDATRCTAGGF